jgi:hypothetical protein
LNLLRAKSQSQSFGESGDHASQPRVPFSKSTEIQTPHLLESLNLLEIQSMNTNRQAFHRLHMTNDPSIHSSLSHET